MQLTIRHAVSQQCCTEPQTLFWKIFFLNPGCCSCCCLKTSSFHFPHNMRAQHQPVFVANHLCRCFYAEILALPLVLDDVICKCCEGNSDVMFSYIFFRQYMNRKGGFNRPLDFIAWKCHQLIVIVRRLPLSSPVADIVQFPVISNLFSVMQQFCIYLLKWTHTCK